MGHDDNFLKNPLNCKGYLQNIEFDNLDCTFIQVYTSVDKNVLCKKNTKRNEKYAYDYEGEKIIRIHETLQSPT